MFLIKVSEAWETYKSEYVQVHVNFARQCGHLISIDGTDDASVMIESVPDYQVKVYDPFPGLERELVTCFKEKLDVPSPAGTVLDDSSDSSVVADSDGEGEQEEKAEKKRFFVFLFGGCFVCIVSTCSLQPTQFSCCLLLLVPWHGFLQNLLISGSIQSMA